MLSESFDLPACAAGRARIDRRKLLVAVWGGPATQWPPDRRLCGKLVLTVNQVRPDHPAVAEERDNLLQSKRNNLFDCKSPADRIRCGCERRPHAPSWPLRRNGRRPGDWGPGPECGLRVRHGEGRGRPDGPGVGSADHGGGGVTVQAAGHVLPAAGPCMRLQRQGGGC